MKWLAVLQLVYGAVLVVVGISLTTWGLSSYTTFGFFVLGVAAAAVAGAVGLLRGRRWGYRLSMAAHATLLVPIAALCVLDAPGLIGGITGQGLAPGNALFVVAAIGLPLAALVVLFRRRV